MHLKRQFFFCSIFLVFLGACGNDEPVSQNTSPAVKQDSVKKFIKKNFISEKAKKLDVLFKNKVKTTGFNGCVLVSQQGHIVYKNVFGYSNFKTRDSLNINSAFQLASTSKTLTAAAILLLKDQNKLKLTDNVQKFFPDFPYLNITIQLLLTHRSGLSNYLYFSEPYCDANNCYNGKVFDNNSMLRIIADTKPAPYASPNKKFEYCNTNYALLASIVEKVSGQRFADFMAQNVFTPLGMNNTWVRGTKNDTIYKYKTTGHNASGYVEKDNYADDVVGDKGIFSTVDDLFKWNEALYSEKLLKKATIEEAFTGYSNEHQGKRNYGYGWRLIDEDKNNKIVYHNGWWHGFSTLFYRKLSDKTTVIILSNKYNSNTYHIEDVLAILNSTEYIAPKTGLFKRKAKK
ncbi:MAG: serine hydrolase domain-containing protein [Bacteroidota bacterium]